MKKLFKITLLLVSVVMMSCKNEASLQSYLVESQDKKGFISLDVPASVIQLSMDKASEEDKKAYESIRKVNVTGLPAKSTDAATYEAEKNKLKEIMKNSSYKKLMNFKKDGMHATIYYAGETDAIDEIVAFAYGKELGVGVARLLGENMNPAKILDMMQNSKVEGDNLNLSQFKAFFDGKKLEVSE